jgi:hypothetical protein
VDGPWTTLADSASEPRNSWTSGLGSPPPAPYCRSCPKGPRDRKRRRRCLHRRWRLRTRGSFGRFAVPVSLSPARPATIVPRCQSPHPPRRPRSALEAARPSRGAHVPGHSSNLMGRSPSPGAPGSSASAGIEPRRAPIPPRGTIVHTLWITLAIARPLRRISWTSGLGSARAAPYCRSCPKGPRTSSEPVGTCIDWRI